MLGESVEASLSRGGWVVRAQAWYVEVERPGEFMGVNSDKVGYVEVCAYHYTNPSPPRRLTYGGHEQKGWPTRLKVFGYLETAGTI